MEEDLKFRTIEEGYDLSVQVQFIFVVEVQIIYRCQKSIDNHYIPPIQQSLYYHSHPFKEKVVRTKLPPKKLLSIPPNDINRRNN